MDRTEHLKALKAFRHEGQELKPGDTFYASPTDARSYRKYKRAEPVKGQTAEATPTPAPAPVPTPAAAPAPAPASSAAVLPPPPAPATPATPRTRRTPAQQVAAGTAEKVEQQSEGEKPVNESGSAGSGEADATKSEA